jgi:GGDEF domain-containing protein
MAGLFTARLLPRNERQKARARLILFGAISLIGPLLFGSSIVRWLFYFMFVLLYSLWALRLTAVFADSRLGYLLCLTDIAVMLPFLVWSSNLAIRLVIVAICFVGIALSIAAQRTARERQPRVFGLPAPVAAAAPTTGPNLPMAVRSRMRFYTTAGERFGLLRLDVVRFQESADYFGPETADRLLDVVVRRALRQLGPDAEQYQIQPGSVAFLLAGNPREVEEAALVVARKVSEHLIEGRRIECLIGHASAPGDGIDADELLRSSASNSFSTASFRRVMASSAAGNRARAAAG